MQIHAGERYFTNHIFVTTSTLIPGSNHLVLVQCTYKINKTIRLTNLKADKFSSIFGGLAQADS
jgi:hypothetical protein